MNTIKNQKLLDEEVFHTGWKEGACKGNVSIFFPTVNGHPFSDLSHVFFDLLFPLHFK